MNAYSTNQGHKYYLFKIYVAKPIISQDYI